MSLVPSKVTCVSEVKTKVASVLVPGWLCGQAEERVKESASSGKAARRDWGKHSDVTVVLLFEVGGVAFNPESVTSASNSSCLRNDFSVSWVGRREETWTARIRRSP